jgi:hypothetical protein
MEVVMTPEEYEVAYCKGRRQEMEDFVEWIDDHIAFAKGARADGVSDEKVLNRMLEFMGTFAERMTKKLAEKPKLISKTGSDK